MEWKFWKKIHWKDVGNENNEDGEIRLNEEKNSNTKYRQNIESR